ncbi:hypothetical protein M758_2G200000 [Ceratodon purpureus]|nr:hypothetical protein M758_2G200000 [Ceratodon purpureus]
MKMTGAGAATTIAVAGSDSPSRSFGLKEKLGKLHLFTVDRTNRWPVQGWSSGDESHLELDEQFVAEESGRAFTVGQGDEVAAAGLVPASQQHPRCSCRFFPLLGSQPVATGLVDDETFSRVARDIN